MLGRFVVFWLAVACQRRPDFVGAVTWETDGDCTCVQPCEQDLDQDGYCYDEDCNDDDPEVNPGAIERCNGVDDDCDGVIDDGFDESTWYPDLDDDGHGDPDGAVESCDDVDGYATRGDDCDDTDPAVHPGADEPCDEPVDLDCDGVMTYVDADLDDVAACIDCDDADTSIGVASTAWVDADADGYGDSTQPVETCELTGGLAAVDGDCDDTDPTRSPSAPDVDGDGVDSDCDGADD